MTVAVLALQGAFEEHRKMLNKLSADSFEIRQKKDALRDYDGLIIPGGESTVMGKLLRDLDLFDLLKEKIENGLPVFGTCAGLLLLAKQIYNDEVTHLSTMDITAQRNAYGRQLGSFFASSSFGDEQGVPMTFIRAPYIKTVQADTQVLSTVDGKIVAARQKNQLVTAFHPELNDDLRIHKYFLDMIDEANTFRT
ncbi:MAG: pyridoxal 5'-phosphate synthase glutaminase subunit PdxT [Acutalibacteraceae bacterium]